MKEKVEISFEDGQVFDFPVINSTRGPKSIDVRNLYKNTNYFAYDPGFFSTASCKSDITYINGEKGILQYRGEDIDKIVEKHDFFSVAHLLFYKVYPQEKELFIKKIQNYSSLEPNILNVISQFPKNAHPMSILMSAITMLAALYNDKEIEESFIILLAKSPYIVAAIYTHINGTEFHHSDFTTSYWGNFLFMLFGNDIDPLFVDALEKFSVLHADHEQNASTSTARIAASTGVHPIACIAAAVASLWGTAHGGANEQVLHMLNDIKNFNSIQEFIEKAKSGESKLMGFGHRVYKSYDPRGKVLCQICNKILKSRKNVTSDESELFNIAIELEKVALNDEYFISRNLYPNVDFYSGIIMKAMGIPVSMFTTIFAISRIPGWISQVRELTDDSDQKIYRPRQVYIGK